MKVNGVRPRLGVIAVVVGGFAGGIVSSQYLTEGADTADANSEQAVVLVDAGVAHLKATTITYLRWRDKVYPPGVRETTEWAKAFAAFEAAKAALAPPAPPPPTTTAAPTTTAPPPTTTAPPPPPPPVASPRELKYPRNPGAHGIHLAATDFGPSIADFTRIDHENINTGGTDRIWWWNDPAGSARIVTKFKVNSSDNADRTTSTRTQLWYDSNPNAGGSQGDHVHGQEAWFAWGWYYPSATWPPPDGWFLDFQNHGGTGNPAQAVEHRIPDVGGPSRTALKWKNQTAPTSGWTYHQIEPVVTKNQWHYFLAHVKFRNDGTGESRIWHALGSRPDPGGPPVAAQTGINTIYPGFDGVADVMFYRAQTNTGQEHIGFMWGYGRAASAARAMELAELPLS